MKRYVALLRGIAPSGANMTNDKLRGVFEGLGFTAVGSVLASGNITFRTAEADVPSLETRIEEALVSGLCVTSRTIIREYSELRSLVDCLSTVLSELESRVLSLYLDGHSYQAVGELLGCDCKTVDNALQRVKRKVGAHLQERAVLL